MERMGYRSARAFQWAISSPEVYAAPDLGSL